MIQSQQIKYEKFTETSGFGVEDIEHASLLNAIDNMAANHREAMEFEENQKYDEDQEEANADVVLWTEELCDMGKVRKLLFELKSELQKYTTNNSPEDEEVITVSEDEIEIKTWIRLLETYYRACANPFAWDTVSVKVYYKYGRKGATNKFGRLFGYVQSSFEDCSTFRQGSLQSFPRVLRNFLAAENYLDLDFVNAHPTILFSLLQRLENESNKPTFPFMTNNLPVLGKDSMVPDFPHLKFYVKNRDETLKSIIRFFGIQGMNPTKKCQRSNDIFDVWGFYSYLA